MSPVAVISVIFVLTVGAHAFERCQVNRIPSYPIQEIYEPFSFAEFILIDENDERIYVSDRVTMNVKVLNYAGQLIQTIDQGFNNPIGMALSDTGILYVVDSYNHQIVATTKDGTLVKKISNTRFFYPHGIAIGPDGLLYVAMHGGNRILALTTDGWIMKDILTNGGPTDVAFGLLGRMHVAIPENSRIDVFDSRDRVVASVPIDSPLSLDIDSCGYIYVGGGHPGRVRILDKNYNLVREMSDYTAHTGRGVARWEGKNEVFTADGYGRTLYRF